MNLQKIKIYQYSYKLICILKLEIILVLYTLFKISLME